jgi:hypothetical protein
LDCPSGLSDPKNMGPGATLNVTIRLSISFAAFAESDTCTDETVEGGNGSGYPDLPTVFRGGEPDELFFFSLVAVSVCLFKTVA